MRQTYRSKQVPRQELDESDCDWFHEKSYCTVSLWRWNIVRSVARISFKGISKWE